MSQKLLNFFGYETYKTYIPQLSGNILHIFSLHIFSSVLRLANTPSQLSYPGGGTHPSSGSLREGCKRICSCLLLPLLIPLLLPLLET